MTVPLYLTFGNANYTNKPHSGVCETVKYGSMNIDLDVGRVAVGAEIFLEPFSKVCLESRSDLMADVGIGRRRALVWPDWSTLKRYLISVNGKRYLIDAETEERAIDVVKRKEPETPGHLWDEASIEEVKVESVDLNPYKHMPHLTTRNLTKRLREWNSETH